MKYTHTNIHIYIYIYMNICPCPRWLGALQLEPPIDPSMGWYDDDDDDDVSSSFLGLFVQSLWVFEGLPSKWPTVSWIMWPPVHSFHEHIGYNLNDWCFANFAFSCVKWFLSCSTWWTPKHDKTTKTHENHETWLSLQFHHHLGSVKTCAFGRGKPLNVRENTVENVKIKNV